MYESFTYYRYESGLLFGNLKIKSLVDEPVTLKLRAFLILIMEGNRTAMQEIMDIVEMDYVNGVEISMKVFYKMLLAGLKKEKQQIMDAYCGGCKQGAKYGIKAEDYYKETFK